ncbi:ABC transporter substrate-binding protein [Paenibacillus sp. FSL H8-0537]|uniref:ABC transporter substrate-binding protein n=1 Tax=Paenibacillus sp. FSL H8-0537 TaxID=2921399 RepID=UPI003101ACF0
MKKQKRVGSVVNGTRKYTIRLATLLIGCLIVLAGCGTAANSGTKTTASPVQQTTATTEQEQAGTSNTRVVTDSYGEKEIPANPQRIFSVSATTPLLALGITPIGGLNYEITPDYYLNSYKDQITIAGDYPINYESVLELKPDLIIASSFVEADVVDQLSKIAPTVIYPWEVNLYEQLKFIAGVVGKEAVAEQWIKQHEEKAAKYKEEIKQYVEPDETVAAIQIFKNSFQVAGNRNMGHVLYDLLGLKPLPSIQKQIDESEDYFVYTDSLSLEKLPEYDADRLIVKVDITQPGSEQFFEEMQQSAIWKSLSAVKNGKVYIVPHEKWWSYTLFSTDALLDETMQLFKK